ncbi:hypothetical protein H2200_005818 [Cladophialophora chaetospira]|uniref:Major facilitator superfamily (MFS) profile domain-containing protein n=1 Tax=Cladophialophora chaetospira TaxID=386627 RepID=A0AA38X9W7_9EURO|nr:hypothetical protein H2200_005818 [Cladophialophora chaetospira]
MTSIFPYAWLLTKKFGVADPSFWAGVLIASFSFSEALCSLVWGALSDRIGRKPCLLLGCFGTILSLMMVGFSTSFTMALIGRLLGGILNGNIGVIQTVVGELTTKPEWEPKAFVIMPFIWAIGTILGPAIGGIFANPVASYPDHFSRDGLFGRFPWLLPNLICAAFMLVSIITCVIWFKETHPDFQPGRSHRERRDSIYQSITEQTPAISAGGANADNAVDLNSDTYGTFTEVGVQKLEQWRLNEDGTSRPPSISDKEKWLTKKIVMLTLALSIYTYHSMCYDHLLPIFYQGKSAKDISIAATSPFDVRGGLGLSTKDVGLIMSVNGVIALFIQGVIFPLVAKRLGTWNVFVLVTVLHPVALFIVPYLALLPRHFLYPGIYFCLTVRNFLSILDYPVILILLKQASPSPSCLGRINGLAASAGAACRCVAPPIAGILYERGADIGFTGLAWWAAGFVALIGVFQLYFVPRVTKETTVYKAVVPCLQASANERMSDVIDVTVVEDDD